MIIPDKKKAVTVILAKKMAGGGEVQSEIKPEHSIGEHDQVLHNIADDLLHAVNIKSAHAVVSALKAFVEALEMNPHEEGMGSNEDDAEGFDY